MQRTLAACRQCVLAGFACFFALIAPTICWGGVVEAAHGHPGAHFVFRPPVVPHGHGAGTLPHDHCLPRAWSGVPESIVGEQPAAPDGVARPATLLTALLLVLWLVELFPLQRLVASTRRLANLLDPPHWCCLIPTPPPRRLALG